MQILLQNQPRAELSQADILARRKYEKAIKKVSKLKGNIVRMKGFDNLFRFRNKFRRIHFSLDKKGRLVIVAMLRRSKFAEYQEVLP